ncbi:MAG: tRNA 2-selenouridine(34) synthase MnmH [Bacteroidales bacterium]|jgi:tRNA 2-selenouridine synthase|nr:tRNA 2-selenouridine(34) synthase MnmH [Bacteroidales bacterium]MDD2263532.1 tRNA 2-selenouridine(34) synthase MnmH [Bacteroidales bacterium]MDD2830678.1 tRNA 2-selenouridine(34) synthase MnmH [Bacteroidales bacterium]MDD3207877.1 tRNA 2-selenouridine(34) synthase MnmH [Bacteroidales bacterium]MDD3696616.1 tRNA 2-selenouridine(34) synthase MnmH [Bacteroidales bacterium]
MTEPISVEEFLKRSVTTPVADVRTPAEYEKGHIPRAFLFSLFSDAERAEVGTLYVQQGRTAAVLKGLELTGPRLEAMARCGLEIARGGPGTVAQVQSPGAKEQKSAAKVESSSPGNPGASGALTAHGASGAASGGSLLFYCWRGGMRSASVAWLMESVGIRCYTLEKGYKAYRNHVLGFFEHLPHPLKVLGGLTGSGKTERLRQMAGAGEQVIDLEGLAGHKGSAFGNLGLPPQPSTEHFQNLLFDAFSHLDPERPVWVEDESKNVGKCSLPDGLWKKMQQADFYFLPASDQERIDRLMKEYAGFNAGLLEQAILKIEKRLGFDQCRKAVEACRKGDTGAALVICLTYYDKAYKDQLETRKKNNGIYTFNTI